MKKLFMILSVILLVNSVTIFAQNIRPDQIRGLPGFMDSVRSGTMGMDSTHYSDYLKILGLPDTTGVTDDYQMTFDKINGNLYWKVDAGAGGGITDIVEDETPQLGGNLDIQAFDIEGVDATEFSYVDPTSSIQTQLNGKLIDADSTEFRTASDIYYQATGTYLIPSDSTAIRNYSAALYGLIGDTTEVRTFSDLLYGLITDTTEFRTFSDLQYGLITDTTEFRTASDVYYQAIDSDLDNPGIPLDEVSDTLLLYQKIADMSGFLEDADTTEFRTASDIYYQPIDSDLDDPDLALNLVQDSLDVKLNRDEANSIDSDMYVDGSIDNPHLADNAVGVDELATDAVTMDAIDDDGTFTSLTGAWWTTGTTSGGSLTPVIDDADDFAAEFTGANLYGGTFVADGTGTCALPSVGAGMNFTIITFGDIAVVIDPDGADLMYADGAGGADGEHLTNLSTAGDIAVVQYYSAVGWLVTTNGWTPQ